MLHYTTQITLHYANYITLHYTTLHSTPLPYINYIYSYSYNYNYATSHYTTLDYTTLPHIKLHYTHDTTTNTTATTLHYLHYTTATTPLRYNYNYSCSTPHNIQQLWVRWPLQPVQPLQQTQIQPPFGQWIRSAICDSQQPISSIGFLFWNFRHRLVRYYWYFREVAWMSFGAYTLCCMIDGLKHVFPPYYTMIQEILLLSFGCPEMFVMYTAPRQRRLVMVDFVVLWPSNPMEDKDSKSSENCFCLLRRMQSHRCHGRKLTYWKNSIEWMTWKFCWLFRFMLQWIDMFFGPNSCDSLSFYRAQSVPMGKATVAGFPFSARPDCAKV